MRPPKDLRPQGSPTETSTGRKRHAQNEKRVTIIITIRNNADGFSEFTLSSVAPGAYIARVSPGIHFVSLSKAPCHGSIVGRPHRGQFETHSFIRPSLSCRVESLTTSMTDSELEMPPASRARNDVVHRAPMRGGVCVLHIRKAGGRASPRRRRAVTGYLWQGA